MAQRRTTITKRDAEKVLAAVRDQFAGWIEGEADGPHLVMDWDWPSSGTPTPSILWEGGPYEWTMMFPHGGRDAEFGLQHKDVSDQIPDHVFVEPYTGWATCLYLNY